MENVIENNELIAGFMGLAMQHASNDGKFPLFENPHTGEYEDSIELSYNESWDWLMPVVNLCKERQIFGSQNLIDKIDNVLTCNCEIENLYETVVEFIKFYNDKK